MVNIYERGSGKRCLMAIFFDFYFFVFSESKGISAQQVEKVFQNNGLLTKLWPFIYTHHNRQT